MFESEDGQFEDRQFEDGQPDEPQEEIISLEGLSEAFAEAIGGSGNDDAAPIDAAPVEEADREDVAGDAHDAPEEGDGEDDWNNVGDGAVGVNEANEVAAADGADGADELPSSYGDEAEEDDPCPISPQTILEAMLFVGNAENRSLESRRVAELMRGVEAEEIPELVDRLNARYESNGCPYKIFAEGSGYRLKLVERFHALRNKFYGRVREARLSQAAIDVLAIVAYRQPITVDEVNRLRDRSCNHILSHLVRRRLLQIERPADKSTKPLFRTTDRFLELFRLDNIDELPQSEGVAT